jgi:hypothetical protein
MLGHGTEIGRFGCKNRPSVMDIFTMLCALQGHVALKRQMSTIGDVPLQTLKRSHRIWASSLQQEGFGRGDVWCPTVQHGTWVARFSNGVTTITGNTSCVGRALALLGFEVKRSIASREEVEKASRMQEAESVATTARARPLAAPQTTPASTPTPEQVLDAEILQSANELGYDAAKVRNWVNKKYGVTDGLDSLPDQDKHEVLKIFRERAQPSPAKPIRK